jgi:hypothetical protein
MFNNYKQCAQKILICLMGDIMHNSLIFGHTKHANTFSMFHGITCILTKLHSADRFSWILHT